VRDRSFEMVRRADKLLIVGSSLAVWSSFRLCKEAAAHGKPIAIVNTGETRADPLAELKLDQGGCGTILEDLVARLGLD